MKVAIKEAENIIAFSRIANSLKDIREDIIKIEKVDELLFYIKEKKDILILASGDPCFYGISEYLKAKGIVIEKILAGLSSFQYLMAKLNKSWHKAAFISLHGRKGDLDKVKENKLSIILTDWKNPPSLISKKLGESGVKGRMFIAYNLSYKDEIIDERAIGEEIEDISDLAIVVIENEMD